MIPVGKEPDKRPDFGDAPIANAKYDCAKCPLKAVGCTYIVNTLRCEITIKRLRKLASEVAEGKEVGASGVTKAEEDTAVKNFLASIGEEGQIGNAVKDDDDKDEDDDD